MLHRSSTVLVCWRCGHLHATHGWFSYDGHPLLLQSCRSACHHVFGWQNRHRHYLIQKRSRLWPCRGICIQYCERHGNESLVSSLVLLFRLALLVLSWHISLHNGAFRHELFGLHVRLPVLLPYNNTYTHDCLQAIDRSVVGRYRRVLIDDTDRILLDFQVIRPNPFLTIASFQAGFFHHLQCFFFDRCLRFG